MTTVLNFLMKPQWALSIGMFHTRKIMLKEIISLFLQKILLKLQRKGFAFEKNFFKLRLIGTKNCMQNSQTTAYPFSENLRSVIVKN